MDNTEETRIYLNWKLVYFPNTKRFEIWHRLSKNPWYKIHHGSILDGAEVWHYGMSNRVINKINEYLIVKRRMVMKKENTDGVR